MRRLFRREEPSMAEQAPIQLTPETDLAEATPEIGIDPFDFVAKREFDLERSEQDWAVIAETANKVRGPKFRGGIEEGMRAIYDINGYNGSPILEADVDIAAGNLAIFSLLIARRQSKEGALGVAAGFDVKDLIVSNGDGNVDYLIMHNLSSKLRFGKHVVDLVNKMQNADNKGKAITNDIAETYWHHPEGLLNMAELYEAGIASHNPSFKELREIVASDWHSADPRDSVLRQFCADLYGTPQRFINGFSEQVEAANHDKRMVQVRQMAEFAVAAVSEGETSSSISEVLAHTYKQWGDFKEIQAPFESYVKMKLNEIEQAIATIAGPQRKKNIRAERSPEEIQEFKRTLRVTVGNQPVGPKPAKSSKKHGRAPSLPTVEDIEDIAAGREAEPKSRRLFILKKTAQTSGSRNGNQPVEMPIEGIAEAFSMNDGNGLGADVQRMVERIMREPISRASKKLRSKGGKLSIGGQVINLWRFAPDDAPQLGVHGDNRYVRIVYGFTGDSLLIADILDHGTFDKKYS